MILDEYTRRNVIEDTTLCVKETVDPHTQFEQITQNHFTAIEEYQAKIDQHNTNLVQAIREYVRSQQPVWKKIQQLRNTHQCQVTGLSEKRYEVTYIQKGRLWVELHSGELLESYIVRQGAVWTEYAPAREAVILNALQKEFDGRRRLKMSELNAQNLLKKVQEEINK